MNKAITTALLLTLAATAACNRPSGGNNASSGAASNGAASNTGNATAAAPAAAPAAGQPGEGEAGVRAFLDSIYAPYAREGGTGADYAAILEPQLAAALEKTEGGIDADPFIDAQDWTPFRPTYENVTLKGDRATATATFSNGGTATRIDYQMMRTPSGWRVYDVQSGNGGSLRERIMNSAQ